MISKELLSEVLNASIYYMEMQSKNIIVHYDKGMPLMYDDSINIYELAHKCKEWAYNKGYIIKTDIAGEWELYNFKNGGIFDTQNSSSEQQSVFDACQYILDNKDKQ